MILFFFEKRKEPKEKIFGKTSFFLLGMVKLARLKNSPVFSTENGAVHTLDTYS